MTMGRPSKLNPKRHQRIVDAMRNGSYFDTACRVAGINPSTGFRWLAYGDDPPRNTHPSESMPTDLAPFRDFRNAVLKAEAESEEEAVAQIKLAGREDWRAAAEYVKLRNPDRYGRQRIDVKHTGQVEVDAGTKLLQSIERYADVFDKLDAAPLEDAL